MTQTIMMYAGAEGPQFDATRWFTNGMYKRRQIELGGRQVNDEVSMLRVSPPPFIPEQERELSSWAFVVLQREFPQVDAQLLLESPPDLRHRTVYVGSSFSAPDKPVDGYNLYLSLHGRRYVISLERDALTGKLIHASSATPVPASDTETNRVFERLEAAERTRQAP